MATRKRGILPLACAVALAACSDALPTEPDHAVQRPSELRGLHAEFERIAQEVPGFGGMYYGAEGRLHVTVVGEASPAAVKRAIADRSGVAAAILTKVSRPDEEIVIEPGDYDFVQLARWYGQLRPALRLGGVVYTDIDEATNRLRVGVEPSASPADIAAAIAGYGVPAEAVTVEVTEKIVPLKGITLADRVQPLGGGLQLVFRNPMPGFVSICTLGFNILMNDPGRSQGYFITNSHCSDTRGTVDGTPYHQQPIAPLNPALQIGTEVIDPPFLTSAPACPYAHLGYVCRYSDAAVAAYETSRTPVRFGSIYRTEFYGTGVNVGSTTIANGPDHFTISSEAPYPLGGETLNKIGRTTGWTRGPVIGTCGDFVVPGTNIVMLCQDLVQARVGGGDSGSPVFQQVDDSRYATLYGVLWGGGTTLFVFSAMENIRFEIGSFTTH